MKPNRDVTFEELSPSWKHSFVLIMALGFTLLIWRSVQTYSDAPPIPARAVAPNGDVVFTIPLLTEEGWTRHQEK